MKQKITAVILVALLLLSIGCTKKEDKAIRNSEFVFITDSVNNDSDKVKEAKLAFDDKSEFNNINYKFILAKNIDSVADVVNSSNIQSADYIFLYSGVISDHCVNELKTYTDKTVVVIDEDSTYQNASCIDFMVNESAFLAGVLAACESKTGHVGYIGYEYGKDIETEVGFISGVKTILPDCSVEIVYAGSYNSVDAGYECAMQLFENKTDVIFSCCGASSIGVNKCVTEHGIYIICEDLYELSDKSNCIAEISKKYTNAVSYIIDECLNGTFEPGNLYRYGLSAQFVDITLSDKVDSSTAKTVEDYRQKIMWKSLVVPSTYEEYNILFGIDQSLENDTETVDNIDDLPPDGE